MLVPIGMRRTAHFPRLALTTAMLLSSTASIAEGNCDTGRSEVHVSGPQPLIQELIEAVPQSAGIFFEHGKFHRAQVNYVGRLTGDRTSWDLVYLSTDWGDSCRETKRLLVFDATGSYVGSYSGVDQPALLTADRIIFPTGEEARFEHASPPDRLYVDGEVYSLERP